MAQIRKYNPFTDLKGEDSVHCLKSKKTTYLDSERHMTWYVLCMLNGLWKEVAVHFLDMVELLTITFKTFLSLCEYPCKTL